MDDQALRTASSAELADAVPGYHLLQAPGPSNVPGRVLRAMSAPTLDHRGPQFAELAFEVIEGMQELLRTTQPVLIFPSSGTGGWEAALVSTLSPGALVLAFDHGHFARLWADAASRLGYEVELVPGDWRQPVSESTIEQRLLADTQHDLAAVLLVHNETSTGVVTDIADCRGAMDRAGHPALLLVDTISSAGSLDYRHDDWGVDVTIGGSQKGLMLPPGLAFNAASAKALAVSHRGGSLRSYWDWRPVLEANSRGFFPYTPPTNLLFGLRESLAMLREERLESVFLRHERHARAARHAVSTWGFETVCQHDDSHSPSVTGVMLPDGVDPREIRRQVLHQSGVSLGTGLGLLEEQTFRIGHLGDFNDAMLIGTLGAIELGLATAGIPYASSGVAATIELLATWS